MSPKYLRKYRIPDENWGLDPSQYAIAAKLTDDDIDLLIAAAASEGIELGDLGPKVEQLIAAHFLELEPRANRRVVAKVTRDGLAAILIKHPLP
jgi:hypothetical protein